MEGRSRRKWENNRRSQNRRPPRGNWQPTVPKWEKEFCKVVGSLDWETLLQMKKFTHLYENVINWDDSAGEEALSNAKRRFWAETNGISCNLPSPDPDLYIDKIDWDSESNTEPLSDIETEPITSNADESHEPVVIFGDSLFPNHAYSLEGWGDDGENFRLPDNNILSPNHGEPWEQNGDNSFDNEVAIGSPGFSNNDWDWNYVNNYNNNNNNSTIYQVGPDTKHSIAREWNSFNSCGPVSHRAAITVGHTWNH